jgi:hypothetical protein
MTEHDVKLGEAEYKMIVLIDQPNFDRIAQCLG